MEREPLGDITNRKIDSPKEKLQKERNYGRKAVNSFKNYIGRLTEKQTIHYYSTADTEDTNQERYRKIDHR